MRLILTTTLIAASIAASAQSAYDKLLGGGNKSNITFFADEARSSEITKLESGKTTFYALVPLNKKHFKFPLGKLAGYAEFDALDISAIVTIKDGYSTSDNRIYATRYEFSGTLSEMANSNGEVLVKFKLDDDVNFISNVDEVLESGEKVYDLTVSVGDKKEPIGYGVLPWDLTDGGAAFKEADLASRANYSFTATDDVVDPDFKAKVKADIERRLNVVIYQMAHGDRVPYSRGTNYYRRNQIGITYKDNEDGKCYTGGISAFEDGQGPGGPYSYDMEGSLSEGSEIPCDRVDK